MLKKIGFLVLTMALSYQCYAQAAFPKKEIIKAYKLKSIAMDEGNGDGVFLAQSKKTKLWGMYQWGYEGSKCTELIPMNYDSLRYFPFNGAYTAVYKDGKVGFYLSKWSFESNAKQSVPCSYDNYQRMTVNGDSYLAVQKGNYWAWVNWYTGKEMSEFKYVTVQDLPWPRWKNIE